MLAVRFTRRWKHKKGGSPRRAKATARTEIDVGTAVIVLIRTSLKKADGSPKEREKRQLFGCQTKSLSEKKRKRSAGYLRCYITA